MNKKTLFFITIFLISKNLFAQDLYKIDNAHTNLIWYASHFGFSKPSGKFTDIEGKIFLDERNPQNSSVEIIVKTNSITTGFTKFDNHLKSADFFDVEKFPLAIFKSQSIRSASSSGAKVSGILTIKEIKKLVNFDVKINKIGKNPITQNKTIGMTISGTIKRSDYGITYGAPGIGDEVKIEIECEAIYQGSTGNESALVNDSGWQIIENKSKLEFTAKQNGSAIKGSFKKFNGKINFDPNALAKSNVEIEIDTTSADLSFQEALQTLKNQSWLATETFPKAFFKADNFVAMPGKNNFSAKGTLKIKDKTIPATLNFNLKAINERYAHAVGNTTIKRTDFDIGEKNVSKANGVEDQITINFEVQASKL